MKKSQYQYPEQYFSKSISGHIEQMHPIFKDAVFDFWVSFVGVAALIHPQTRSLLGESYGHIITDFIEYFNNEVGSVISLKEDHFSVNVKLDQFLRPKTVLLTVTMYEQLKKNNLLEKVKQRDIIIYHFLRHLRNAAAHNNIFNLKDRNGSWRTDLGCSWRDKEINQELHRKSLHEFFPYNLAIIMALDISHLLKK